MKKPALLLLFLGVFITFPFTTVVLAQTDFTVMSQNTNRLFDHRNDGNNEKILPEKQYRQRLNRLSQKILQLGAADLIALQEVENKRVLNDLKDLLSQNGHLYQSVLIEGEDQSGIDVGFLIKKPYRIKHSQQILTQYRLGPDRNPLFTRPPLLVEVCHRVCVTVINLHLRSMRGLGNHKKGEKVAHKRLKQSEQIARWVNQFQNKHPNHHLLVMGDFNALPVSDRYVDVIGTIKGEPDQTRPRWKSTDFIDRNLVDLTLKIPQKQRVSFRYKKRNQQLDYLFANEPLRPQLQNIAFGRIDYRISDHAPLIAKFNWN